MKWHFYKYQGTGNDFVIIDNRNLVFPKTAVDEIAKICDRRFGVGADGLILLENHHEADFRMVYFNSDGRQGSMCGNGGRCLVAFANFLGLFEEQTIFEAIDGLHKAYIKNGLVYLHMQDVPKIAAFETHSFLDTGSPHHVQLVDDLDGFDVKGEGARLRYGKYGEKGSNINFVVALGDNSFRVRTYERGVEDETLSCGTGVVAAAIAMHQKGRTSSNGVKLKVEGGELEVTFEFMQNLGYKNVVLIGPAQQIFEGKW
ncbi:MAG: diaminopimelate epimerase [Flavobacteriaceae bacterium]|nr:diaminopimelate epimerase [Flavobacteriaceae bacterium]